jgi:Asp-tRNA(Asn)/Glu-tRNA(Gln) amidotransferase A subunit family amidase
MQTSSPVTKEPRPPFTLSVPEAVERIRGRNPVLHAFISTRLEEALVEAGERAKESPASPVHGVPYSLKDQWDTAGIATTGGSYRYRTRVPKVSSPVHLAFEAAGAVLLGKTNLSDLAMVPESANYLGGTARNPHNLGRTTGGSSGGAAAAVVDGMSAFDWGADIGGSIRLPAAFCGALGLRLSSETWPMIGDFPSPPASLHYMNGQGPITTTFEGMRTVLRVAAPTLRTGPTRPFELRGAFLYVPRPDEGMWPSFATDVSQHVARAAGDVRTDHGLLYIGDVRRIYDAMWCSHFEDLLSVDEGLDFSSGLRAVLSGVFLRGRFGDRRLYPSTAEVFGMIALGRATVFRDRKRAEDAAQRYRKSVQALWDRGYLVVSPTCLFPAPRHGRANYNRKLQTCVTPGNLADTTGLAVPFGHFPDGLPRSVQIWGPPGSEDVVIDVGERLLESAKLS